MPKSRGGKKLAKFLYMVSGNDSQKCRRMKCSGCPPAFRERKSPNLFLKSQKIKNKNSGCSLPCRERKLPNLFPKIENKIK